MGYAPAPLPDGPSPFPGRANSLLGSALRCFVVRTAIIASLQQRHLGAQFLHGSPEHGDHLAVVQRLDRNRRFAGLRIGPDRLLMLGADVTAEVKAGAR